MHFNRQLLYLTFVFAAQRISGLAIEPSQALSHRLANARSDPSRTPSMPSDPIPPMEGLIYTTMTKPSSEPAISRIAPPYPSIHVEIRQVTGATGAGETASGPTLYGATAGGPTADGATAGGPTASGALASGASSSGALSSRAFSSGAASSGAVSGGIVSPSALPSGPLSYAAYSSGSASRSVYVSSPPSQSALFPSAAVSASSLRVSGSSGFVFQSSHMIAGSSTALPSSRKFSASVSASSEAFSESSTAISPSSSSQTSPTIVVLPTTRSTTSTPTSRTRHTTRSRITTSISTSTSSTTHSTSKPSHTAAEDPRKEDSNNTRVISHAAVAGIATGVAAGAVMVALGGLYLYRRRKHGKPLFGPRGSQRSQNSVYPKVAWLYDPNMDSPPHSRSASGDGQFLIPAPRPGVAEMEAGLAGPDMRPSRSSSPLLPPTITLTRDDWPSISPEGSPNRAGGRRSRPMMSIHEENE